MIQLTLKLNRFDELMVSPRKVNADLEVALVSVHCQRFSKCFGDTAVFTHVLGSCKNSIRYLFQCLKTQNSGVFAKNIMNDRSALHYPCQVHILSHNTEFMQNRSAVCRPDTCAGQSLSHDEGLHFHSNDALNDRLLRACGLSSCACARKKPFEINTGHECLAESTTQIRRDAVMDFDSLNRNT